MNKITYKPKILILMLNCNKDFFIKSANNLQKILDREIQKYDNLNYYIFTSGKTECINEHNIIVNCKDDWTDTFYKNKRCFQLLEENNIEYDLIVRINTSTILNFELLINLCQYIYDNNANNTVYCCEINMHNGYRYPIGKLVIFNKWHINKIINSDKIYETMNHPDDVIYGIIFNNTINYKALYFKYKNYWVGYPLNITNININTIKSTIGICVRDVNRTYNDICLKHEIDDINTIDNLYQQCKYDDNDIINCINNGYALVFNHDTRKFENI